MRRMCKLQSISYCKRLVDEGISYFIILLKFLTFIISKKYNMYELEIDITHSFIWIVKTEMWQTLNIITLEQVKWMEIFYIVRCGTSRKSMVTKVNKLECHYKSMDSECIGKQRNCKPRISLC